MPENVAGKSLDEIAERAEELKANSFYLSKDKTIVYYKNITTDNKNILIRSYDASLGNVYSKTIDLTRNNTYFLSSYFVYNNYDAYGIDISNVTVTDLFDTVNGLTISSDKLDQIA